ncbi:MAG: lipopolysaccharide heptosyltransferase I [Betaproteobacteria bacterium]
MQSALIIRPSSLGDIVHALPVVHDLARHCADIAVDWVAEESFVGLVALNPRVRRVIPVALRRWRRRPLARATWRELGTFRRELAAERYTAVIDFQEQVKGALIASMARGPTHGPDRASIREPAATLAYRYTHRIDPAQHLIDRCRALAGAAFGYAPDGAPQFGLVVPPPIDAPEGRYAVFLHASSRDDKLWPETHWRALLQHVTRAGVRVVLPWGTHEEAVRSAVLAVGIDGALVPLHRSIARLAALLSRAEFVCGVDTGLVHLAAALGVPTLALFSSTEPRLAGVGRASASGRDLGGVGFVATPAQVIEALGALMREAPAC